MPKEHEKVMAELAKSGHVVPESRFVEDENGKQESAEKKSGDGGAANADIDPNDSEHGYHGEMLSREEYEKKLKAGPSENKAALDSAAAVATTPQPVRGPVAPARTTARKGARKSGR